MMTNLITKIKDEINEREHRRPLSAAPHHIDKSQNPPAALQGGNMTDLGFLFPFDGGKTDISSLKGRELTEFVSGIFLSCGGGRIMTGENRKAVGYNLEFNFENVTNARNFCEILSNFEIFPKLTLTKNSAVIRIQSADCICNFLALVVVKKCLMEMNNEIALRELRNNANRRANCDTGNIEKQVTAAAAQIAIIKSRIENGGIKDLTPKLQETAIVRCSHPDATYEELAAMLNITKSGVVNRLRKIIK